MGFLRRMIKGRAEVPETPGLLQDVKWGVAQPVPVRLADGKGKYRAFGVYSLVMVDQDLFRAGCCDPGDGQQLEEIRIRFGSSITGAFADTLAGVASSLTDEELLGSTHELERGMAEAFRREIAPLGLDLKEFRVMGISGS
jgi:membrane protease subunit (stomatin/prohibitin family)